ncbi:MAG TPA: phosphate ABC transporter permease PstA [Pseudonocardiaceae bacterium]|jgi:phosphate transport system permease protein|nr:phosphate ABC transporter permease PstA [Pseudonocardiaceae bacterium]
MSTTVHGMPADEEVIAGEQSIGYRMAAATPEQRRVLRTRTLDDRLSLVGAAAAAFALVWLLYSRLLPLSGSFGFIVCWYVVFLLIYALVCRQRHAMVAVWDRLMAAVVTGGAVVVGGTLVLVVISTLWQGRNALAHLNFFTTDFRFTGPLTGLTVGGVLHAVVGTLVEIAIVIAITLPLGVTTAIYLNEVGGRAARVVRAVVEAMTALPDVLAGLFVYIVLLVTLGLPASGFAAAVALSITVLPIVARAGEVVLRVVPGGLREASLALGASQWQTVWRVVLPTARPGLATALILGVARGIGETAPVLLTAGYTTYTNFNPFNGSMTSLPLLSYRLSQSSEHNQVDRAFGAASVLLVLVVLLFVIARLAVRHRVGRQ